MQQGETTVFDALIGELLGDVGKVRLEIRALREEMPEARREHAALVTDLNSKLALAIGDAAKKVQVVGEGVGAEVVERVAGDQIKVTVAEVASALAELQATARSARASVERAVETVPIWRQVILCAGSGAASALVVCILIWFFGAKVSVDGCPATLSSRQCVTYLGGLAMQKIWPKLPKQTQDYLKAVNQTVD